MENNTKRRRLINVTDQEFHILKKLLSHLQYDPFDADGISTYEEVFSCNSCDFTIRIVKDTSSVL